MFGYAVVPGVLVTQFAVEEGIGASAGFGRR